MKLADVKTFLTRLTVKKAFRLSCWGLGGLVIGVHLYAIALRFVPVPNTILMSQRHFSGEVIKREWTSISAISPYMVQAVMGGEDGRFCEHKGVDFTALKTAYSENQSGSKRRGGSTITQQTAKNVFFWNGGGYIRKVGEAYFAVLIDFVWGKTRVMEVYLNVAEWGDGIFGVEAAAQERFGTSAKNLNRQQAALLAAVLPSPNKWRVDPPSSYVRGRAKTLRARMSVIQSSRYDFCVTGTAPAKPYIPKAPPTQLVPQVEIQPEIQVQPEPERENIGDTEIEPQTSPEPDIKIIRGIEDIEAVVETPALDETLSDTPVQAPQTEPLTLQDLPKTLEPEAASPLPLSQETIEAQEAPKERLPTEQNGEQKRDPKEETPN